MVDFSARISMLPREQCRGPAEGPAWYCRLRLDQNEYFASMISREDFFLPAITEVVYATLLDPDARSLFIPGTVFGVAEDEPVATGIVEPPDRLFEHGEHLRNRTLSVLQTWAGRRPEWFVGSRVWMGEGSAGWSGLIDDAFAAIDKAVPDRTTHLHVGQVKQKLGALVIYVRHQPDAHASEVISDALNRAYKRSLATCEICGGAGQRGSQSGYVCVRCPVCAPENWSPDHLWFR